MSETKTKQTWQDLRKRDHFTTSASQHETADLCWRKWWLAKVRRLPEPSNGSTVFGTVTHSVCERYLLADDLGRDPATGKAVELYPKDWHKAFNKYTEDFEGEASLAEQDMIRKLVAAAIESGVLERQSGRKIEQEFNQDILEQDGVKVLVTGFIDLSYPNRIEDHKTTKSMKWAKSPKKLKENLQALLYAKMKIEERKQEGGAVPAVMTLRHNIFCKNPKAPKVRKVEVDVPLARIEKEWGHIKENAQQMIHLRKTVDEWHEVPEPKNPAKACNAYDGCCYRSICSGQESELGYEQRVTRYMENKRKESAKKLNKSQPIQQKGNEMVDFKTRLAQKKAMQAKAAGATGTAPAASINPGVPETATPEATTSPAATQAPVQQQPAAATGAVPPPWSTASCPACHGTGFNSAGKGCRICDSRAQAAGRMNSTAYHIQALGNGTVAWVGQEGTAAAGQEGVSPLPVSAQASAPVQADERVSTPPPATPAPATSPVTSAKSSGGRPKKGFILCLNCSPVKGQERKGSGRNVIFLADTLQEVQQQMATAARKESFFDINAFDRRDGLAKAADKIADSFGSDMVVVTGVGTGMTDMKALVDALLPVAGMVILAEAS